MFATQNGSVGIVVEHDAFGSPIQNDRKTGSQADADGRLQALRPVLNWTERGLCPVSVADQAAHFSVAGKPSLLSGDGFDNFRPRCARAMVRYAVKGGKQLAKKIRLRNKSCGAYLLSLPARDGGLVLADDYDFGFGEGRGG